MPHDRFDLEQAIMACWHTTDDLDLLAENLLADAKVEDVELFANALIGLRQLHDLRVKKVFDIFEDMIESGAID